MMSEDFEIFHYRDAYLKDVALHHHDFFELYFFISGDVSYTIESRNYKLLPGDILLISPKELHQPIIAHNQVYERIVLWINCDYLRRLSTEKSDMTRCFDADSENRTNLLRLDPQNQLAMKASVLKLLAEVNSDSEYSDILSQSQLVELVASLNRLFAENTGRYESESKFGDVMTEIVRHINKNHTGNLTLDMLSQEFYISKYHMSREFMRHFGISIHKYITKKRLITAKQLMSEGLPPSRACTKCGFTDYANFYRAFRSEYGIAPREFKEYADASKAESNTKMKIIK